MKVSPFGILPHRPAAAPHFRIAAPNFYAVSENEDGVKIGDDAKCGAGAEAKVKIPKGETFTVVGEFCRERSI